MIKLTLYKNIFRFFDKSFTISHFKIFFFSAGLINESDLKEFCLNLFSVALFFFFLKFDLRKH